MCHLLLSKKHKVARVGPNGSELSRFLRSLEGAGYGAYKDAAGEWNDCPHTIFIDRVQSDSYDPPSHLRVRIAQHIARFPQDYITYLFF